MSQDFYKILGVSHNATDRELSIAYRALARKYHPDKNRAPEALERFKEIQGAYEVLINKEKRRQYDRARGARTNVLHDESYQQFRRRRFSEGRTDHFAMWAPSGGGGDGTAEWRPGVYLLQVSLEELFNGCWVTIKMPSSSSRNTFDRGQEHPGTQLTVVVQVGRGRRNGDTLTYSLTGEPVPNCTPGSATFIVCQKPHKVFEHQDDDLLFKYTLLDSQAAAGCTIQVPLIEGGTMPWTLAAGQVNSSSVMRIPLKGMYRRRWPWGRGDLLIKFDVVPQSANRWFAAAGFRAWPLAVALLGTVGPLAALAYWYCCDGSS